MLLPLAALCLFLAGSREWLPWAGLLALLSLFLLPELVQVGLVSHLLSAWQALAQVGLVSHLHSAWQALEQAGLVSHLLSAEQGLSALELVQAWAVQGAQPRVDCPPPEE